MLTNTYSPTLTFKNDGRILAGDKGERPDGLRSSRVATQVLYLSISRENDPRLNDGLSVRINPETGANGYKMAEDAVKGFGNATMRPAIYTLIEDKKLQINKMASIDASELLPVGLVVKEAGDYRFFLDGLVNYEGTGREVYLIDKTLHREVCLSQGETYSFEAAAGSDDNRFALRIGNQTTDLPESAYSPVRIYAAGGGVWVKNLPADSRVAIYNTAGQLVAQGEAEFYPLSAAGVYIVKVTGAQACVKKLILTL
jgi:hypothetical protein